MAVNFFVEDITFTLKNKQKLKNWIKDICIQEGKVTGNINYIFTSNESVLKINIEYLKHNYFTDIITFNYNEENIVSGDLFISVEKVIENSKEYSVSFLSELHRVIIHGVFHLLGYKDGTLEEEFMMRKMEDSALLLLSDKYNIY